MEFISQTVIVSTRRNLQIRLKNTRLLALLMSGPTLYFFSCWRQHKQIVKACKKGLSFSVDEIIAQMKKQKSVKAKNQLVTGIAIPSSFGYVSPGPIMRKLNMDREAKFIQTIEVSEPIYSVEEKLKKFLRKRSFTDHLEYPEAQRRYNFTSQKTYTYSLKDVESNQMLTVKDQNCLYLKDCYEIKSVVSRNKIGGFKQFLTKLFALYQFGVAYIWRSVIFRGFKVGLKESVFAISFDKKLTFLCDVNYDKKTNSYFMERLRLASSIGLDKIAVAVKRYQRIDAIIVGLFGSLTLYFVAKAAYLFIPAYFKGLASRRQRKIDLIPPQLKLRSVSQFVGSQSDNSLCVVCASKCRSIIYGPCMHFVLCGDCAPNVQKCPICRRDLEKQIKVKIQ